MFISAPRIRYSLTNHESLFDGIRMVGYDNYLDSVPVNISLE